MRLFITRIKAYFSLYKRLFLIRQYIPSGFFSFRKNTFSKRIAMPLFFVFSFSKNKLTPLDYQAISIVETKFSNKITFVSNSFVLSFFKDKKKFLNSISDYNAYSRLLSYNFNPIVYIDFRKRFVITPFIDGVEGDISTKIFTLFEWNYQAETRITNFNYGERIQKAFEYLGINDVVSYVQHGDFRTANSLIDNKTNTLFCIDCDDINFYPALFDFFWLIAWFPNYFFNFFDDKYDNQIKQILNIEKITYQDKDKYLAAFIICAHFFGKGHHLSTDVIKNIPDEYVLSKKAITYTSSN